ncbi:MAG: aldehyde dehydrogenase family protein [Bdellovibrionia bacterium]
MKRFLNFVGDEFRESQSVQWQKVKSLPENEYEVAKSEPLDFVMSLPQQKKALSEYEKWPTEKRVESLLSLAWGLEHRAEEWALLEAQCTGLPVSWIKEKSILAGSRFFKEQAAQLQLLANNGEEISPLGIVAILSPWTLSTRFVSEHLAPALAAGNAVVVKLSHKNPSAVEIFGQLIKESGLPQGLVSLFFGEGDSLGSIIAAHPSVKSVTFAGRADVGKAIIKICAEKLKPCFVEMSSKNNLVLLDGWQQQNLEDIFASAFMGWGQTGWNTNRIFILESQLPELKSKIEEWAQQVQYDSQKFGRLLYFEERNKKMNEHQQKLVEEHGKVIRCQFSPYPLFVFDLPQCTDYQQNEMDLPIFIINSVKYLHEIPKWIDNSDSHFKVVLRGNLEKCLKLSEKLTVPSIEINQWLSQGADGDTGCKSSFWGDKNKNLNSTRFAYVKNVTFR